MKLNDKITIVHVTPDTEIWRRGVDLTDRSQLVVGDSIYVLYTRTASDGSPIAAVVAATEEGDSIELKPHHVTEHRVCAGNLMDIGANTLSVKNGEGSCIMRFTPETEFWRGESTHDPHALAVGDEVVARATVNYPSGELVAEDVTANIGKARGRITKAGPNGVEIAREDEQGNPAGTVTVFFDGHTIFDEGAMKELRVGASLEVIGLKLKHDSAGATTIMRATRVMHLSGPSQH